MELSFLGTGAAFSPSAYNSAALLDRTILLDAGPPLCVHLPRVGVGIEEPRAVLLSHFHADHTFGLASLTLGRLLLCDQQSPLHVFGPQGTSQYLRQLLDLAWGEEMRKRTWDGLPLTVSEVEGGEEFEVEGSRARAYPMRHTNRFPCLGFTVERKGVRLGYSGDAEDSEGLSALLRDCDHAIVEMTYDEPAEMHLSRPEVLALIQNHPDVRFIITHRGTNSEVNGAVLASDFLTLQLPLELPDDARNPARGRGTASSPVASFGSPPPARQESDLPA
jgi:ribonuclease BN (tRNA processing enzyme)